MKLWALLGFLGRILQLWVVVVVRPINTAAFLAREEAFVFSFFWVDPGQTLNILLALLLLLCCTN